MSQWKKICIIFGLLTACSQSHQNNNDISEGCIEHKWNSNFCLDVKQNGYPADEIKQTLFNDTVFRNKVHVDPEILEEGNEEPSTPLCECYYEIWEPKLGLTTKSSYEYIVNIEGVYTQQFPVCLRKLSDSGCTAIQSHMQRNFVSNCKPKESVIQMVVFDQICKKFLLKNFSVITAYTCVITER